MDYKHPNNTCAIDHKHYRRKRSSLGGHHLLIQSSWPSINCIYNIIICIIVLPLLLLQSFTHVSYAQSMTTLPALQQLAFLQNTYLLPGHNMENLRIPELQPVGTIVHQLKAVDKSNENRKITYALTGDTFSVDEETGEVRLMKPLDRERQPQVSTVLNILGSNSDQPLESRRRTIVIEDADDSWPIFLPHKSSLINNPSQGQYVFQAEVSEQAPIGAIVLSELLVIDADEGPNAEIVFECRQRQSSLLACDHFSIESRRLQSGRYSVTLRTKQPLDYERIQSYKLSLIARGKRPSPLKGTPLEAEAIINLNLLNIQDEGPVFVNAPYSLSMSEGLAAGERLLKLIVLDGDLAPQRDLSVIVIDELYKDYFRVVRDPEMSKIWYLETNKTIDREDPRLMGGVNSQSLGGAGNMITINLLAAELNDQGEPLASEQELYAALKEQTYNKILLKRESVSVIVLDQPDMAPQFVYTSSGKPLDTVSSLLVVNVSESIASDSSVPNLDLTVLDLDQGANSRFKLTLVDSEIGPQASEAFALESDVIQGKSEVVLNVLNSSLLDYEDVSKRVYRFSLIASKNAGPSASNNQILAQKLDIQVNILDANDNWPEFERDQYVVSVPEGSPPGHLLATIRARDRDSGALGRVSHILFGLGASKFKVISAEGKIVVGDCVIPQCLDYETQPNYSLTYEARDGGGHTRNVSVIINLLDINDHGPKFTESIYKRELISDNLSSKQNYISPQLIVRAKDEDGPTQGRNNITYRIKSSNLTGLDVEPNSGLVYISQPLDLDSLISRQQQSLTGSSSPLNYRRKVTFEAEVVADDNGTPSQNSTATIVLVVKGNRDGAPQFKQDTYLAYVHENQPVMKPFFQVQAHDPDDKDSQLRYSLGYDLNDLVHIDTQSGQLSFKNKVDYDDFKAIPYNITVYATDNSRPYPLKASAIVSILIQDVNNKRPKFDERQYKSVLVQGKTRPGDVILQVQALDLDLNNRLNYSLIQDQLSLSDRNGQSFKLSDIVNTTSGYLSQMGRPERLKLAQDFERLFAINSRTGAIELKLEPQYSFAASVTLKVRVVDLNQEIYTQGGELQEDFVDCIIFLQTHVDKSPIFAPPWSIERRDYNLSILEELPIETVIFSLLAKDPQTNGRIDTFEKLFESDPRDLFRVDRSGLVMINRRIDYEELAQPKRLSLTVRAITSDSQAFSLAHLNIQVIDLNDNAPQFRNSSYHVSVSESLASGQEIVTVAADDRDSSEFGQVHYSLGGFSSELFTIHSRKGVVALKKGLKLDRDTESTYYLIATASDCNDTSGLSPSSSNPAAAEITTTTVRSTGNAYASSSSSNCKKTSVPIELIVTDENDNEPVFLNVNKRGELEATASETISMGTVITQMVAKDADEGLNGQVAYELVRSDDRVSKLLKVDADGYLSAIGSLSGLGRSTPYKISLRAYDMGKPQSRQSYATLLLTITDVVANDGVPKFVRPRADEVIDLPENVGPSTFVYQVQAVDPDEEANGKLMFKFIVPSDTFEINPFDGVIKTQNRQNFYLDREIVSNYTLIIVAHDLGTPPKQAHQVLTIRITDVNDNEPYFERDLDDPPLVLAVDEEVPSGTLIGTIQAIDKDEGQNALIGYEIIEGNQNQLFRLSWAAEEQFETSTTTTPNKNLKLEANNPCHIHSTGRLDRESRDSFTLTIKATSMSKMRNQLLHLRDPLGGRNPFNQYNASDLSKIRVTIKLNDINDNRPMFLQQNAKSVVDSSAEVYSQLMVLKAQDADASSSPIQYSILDALYYSDSKFKPNDESSNKISYERKDSAGSYSSMKYAFEIHPRTGILRNSVSLRPYTDGYFEIFVKAESATASASGQPMASDFNVNQLANQNNNKCHNDSKSISGGNSSHLSLSPGIDVVENCYTAFTKAVVYVTHQRETFKLVFNKTKLNDRIDEFKDKIQHALEDIMFEPVQVQASLGESKSSSASSAELSPIPGAEKVYLNTFNTDFYEREDGSLDFSTITSCSQLVKFDDRLTNPNNNNMNTNINYAGRQHSYGQEDANAMMLQTAVVPNQVVGYDEVLNLLKTLNATQLRQQKPSLFSQYGLVKIERCLPDKTMYKMTLSERLALYFAAMIALVSILLAFIVSRMRKSYEKNLKLLQRSKYQYMGTPYV